MRKYSLAYYVYVENLNKRKIEKYNVLNDGIIDEILERTKDFPDDKKAFAEQVESILMYHYWARSEWESVLCGWPPNMRIEELTKLNQEVEDTREKCGRDPYALTVNLSTAEKIDVYDQVMMNWNIFIDYAWENLRDVIRKLWIK